MEQLQKESEEKSQGEENSALMQQLSEEIKEQDLTKSQDNLEKDQDNNNDIAIESQTSQQQQSSYLEKTSLDNIKPKNIIKSSNSFEKQPKAPKIVKECAGPMLSGLGQKKQKQAPSPPATQTIQQQLQSDLVKPEGQEVQTMKIQQDQEFEDESSQGQSDQEMNTFFEILSTIKPVRIIKKNEPLEQPKQRKQAPKDIEEDENNEEDLPTVLEEDIPSLVTELSSKGFAQLQSQQSLTEAIINLRRSENIISSYLFSDGSMKQNLVLFTLVNLGIGYYRIGFLEESLVCLENCLVSLKNPSEKTKLPSNCQEKSKDPMDNVFSSQSKFFSELPKRLALKRIRSGLHMQCCIILSEMRRHEDALIHSRLATRLSYKILVDTMLLVFVFYLLSFYNPKIHKELQEVNSFEQVVIEDKLQEIPKQKLNQRNNKEQTPNQQQHNQIKRAASKNSVRPRTSYSPNNQQAINQTGNGTLPIMPRFESGNRNNKQRNIKKIAKYNNNFDLDIQSIKVQKRNNENNLQQQQQDLNNKLQNQQNVQQQSQQKNDCPPELQFLQNWRLFQQNELLSIFQKQKTQWENNDFKQQILKLVSIIIEFKNRIINNQQDLAIGRYKAEEILEILYKFVININDQNILEQQAKEDKSSSPSNILEQADLNTIFKDNNQELPLFTSSILALLQLQPKSSEQISDIMTLKDEISPEQILSKVCFIPFYLNIQKISTFAISLYCSSTETRFLEDEHLIAYLNPHQLLDSEILLGKSLEIVYTFLRGDMIFVSQILVIYQRFHGQQLQPIVYFCDRTIYIQPEDDEMPEKYVVLRPLKGGFTRSQQAQFLPIIRMPAKTMEQMKKEAQEEEEELKKKEDRSIHERKAPVTAQNKKPTTLQNIQDKKAQSKQQQRGSQAKLTQQIEERDPSPPKQGHTFKLIKQQQANAPQKKKQPLTTLEKIYINSTKPIIKKINELNKKQSSHQLQQLGIGSTFQIEKQLFSNNPNVPPSLQLINTQQLLKKVQQQEIKNKYHCHLLKQGVEPLPQPIEQQIPNYVKIYNGAILEKKGKPVQNLPKIQAKQTNQLLLSSDLFPEENKKVQELLKHTAEQQEHQTHHNNTNILLQSLNLEKFSKEITSSKKQNKRGIKNPKPLSLQKKQNQNFHLTAQNFKNQQQDDIATQFLVKPFNEPKQESLEKQFAIKNKNNNKQLKILHSNVTPEVLCSLNLLQLSNKGNKIIS